MIWYGMWIFICRCAALYWNGFSITSDFFRDRNEQIAPKPLFSEKTTNWILTLVYFYRCNILNIDFGKLNSTFCPKSARNQIWTPLLLIKKLLLPLLSASRIFVWRFILEKRMFSYKKVKGIGIWLPSENWS